jgi:hypothetical protein
MSSMIPIPIPILGCKMCNIVIDTPLPLRACMGQPVHSHGSDIHGINMHGCMGSAGSCNRFTTGSG